MLTTSYSYGPLRVTLSDADGSVVSITDRISGLAASFRYGSAYLSQAISFAQSQWSAKLDVCVF